MGDSSIALSQVTVAGIAVALINWLKRSEYFPWITQEKTNLLRVIAIVTSALGAAGIHYTWNPEAHILAFHLPTLAGFVHFVFSHWVPSFVTQEITYQATGSGTAEVLKKILAAVKPGGQA
jgi:hypothetical protein